jgi:hypothetical protein
VSKEGKAGNNENNKENNANSSNFLAQLEQLRDMFQGFGPESAGITTGMNDETLGLEGLGKDFFSSDKNEEIKFKQEEIKLLKVIAENTEELRKLISLSLETQREIKVILAELVERTKG